MTDTPQNPASLESSDLQVFLEHRLEALEESVLETLKETLFETREKLGSQIKALQISWEEKGASERDVSSGAPSARALEEALSKCHRLLSQAETAASRLAAQLKRQETRWIGKLWITAFASSLLASGILLGALYGFSGCLVKGPFDRVAFKKQAAFQRKSELRRALRTLAALKQPSSS